MKHAVFSFFAGQVLKTKWQSLCNNFWKEHVKITKRTPSEGTSNKHSSQWKYCQQLSVLTDVFTPRNVKSNIPPPDVDTIVVDVNEDMCGIMSKRCQQSQCQNPKIWLQLQITLFQLTHHVIQRQGGKEKQKKPGTFSVACIGRKKTEQLEKAVRQKSIMSTQEDEDYHFLMSLLPHLRDILKRWKLAVHLALQQVLIEEGSGESDHTEWSSGSSYYSNSTVPIPSSSYGMQSSVSEDTLHTTYSTTQPSQRYKEPPSTFIQLAQFIQFVK